MITRAILVLSMTCIAACSADAGRNPAARCEAHGECSGGQVCYAGFCIDDGLPEQDSDPVSSGQDASVPASDESDADEVDLDEADQDEPAQDEDAGELPGPECTLCDGVCVNPDKNKHHCGGCGNVCDHGPCKDGMCREDS